MKKALAIALALALTLALCTAALAEDPTAILVKTGEAMRAVKNMTIDGTLAVELAGQSMEIAMNMLIFTEPVKFKVTMNSSVTGNIDMYMEQTDGQLMTYINMAGQWQVMPISSAEEAMQAMQVPSAESMFKQAQAMQSLTLDGEEDVDGKTCYKISGMVDTPAQGDVPAVRMPMSVYIAKDDSMMLRAVTIATTDFQGQTMTATTTMDFTGFNTTADFEVPAEAKAAKPAA